MTEAKMQGGKAAHGKADDMGLIDLQMIQHRSDIIRGAGLRVFRHVLRHVGWRVAARSVGDRTIALAEVAHLRLPRAVVASVFVHENDRSAAAGFLVVQADAIVSLGVWHRVPLPCKARAAACRDGAGRAIRR